MGYSDRHFLDEAGFLADNPYFEMIARNPLKKW